MSRRVRRLVDTLVKALGIAACSQGTMNNVVFGNPRFGYYETFAAAAGRSRGTRSQCCAQPHDQHSHHRSRAHGASVSGSPGAICSAIGFGWRRGVFRRRWRGSGADLSGADVAVDTEPASEDPAFWSERWRAGTPRRSDTRSRQWRALPIAGSRWM